MASYDPLVLQEWVDREYSRAKMLHVFYGLEGLAIAGIAVLLARVFKPETASVR